MKSSKKLKSGGVKVLGTAMSLALTVGLTPIPAFASDLTAGSLSGQATAKSADNTVTCAAYAAAEPAPQILGLNNVNYRDAGEADVVYPMFGDEEVNEAVDPYLYNYKNNLTPGIVIGGRGTGQRASPMSALNAYSTTDATAAQNAVWKTLPLIILGTGSDTIPANEATFYQTNDYLSAQQRAAMGAPASYAPIGVTYNRVTLPDMVKTMYRLAEAAKTTMNSNKSLTTRYGDPLEIAKDYERYVVGTKGYVLKAINSKKVNKKTIANVSNYDSSAKTFTLVKDGVAEGTATTNRYLEAVQGVTNNYADTVGETATADQLTKNVDLIIVGSATDNTGTGSAAAIEGLTSAGLLDKTFYCTSWGAGAVFGTTVNSVENAQNIGRILPCVYPEVLDQSDMIAYYYDVFYHIKDGKLASQIAQYMDGVRNWAKSDSAAYTAWEASDVSSYNHDAVENMLKTGVNYLATNQNPSSYLQPSDYVKSDKAALKDQTITASDITKYKGDAAFKVEATTNGDGKLSYSIDDEKVATITSAGKVTIKGTGKATITITASATEKYGKATKEIALTVKAAPKKNDTVSDVAVASGSTVTVKVTDAKKKTVTIVSGDLKDNASVTVNTVKIGGKTYKVTAIGKNAFKGTKAKKITIGANVKTIGANAFQNPKNATQVVLGKNVTSVGANAFKNAVKLKKLTMGVAVTTIGANAFQNAKLLSSLTIGKNVKKISANAFKGAKKLKTVTIKSSKLTKASFTNLVKNTKIKTVKLSGVSKAATAKYEKWAKSLGVKIA